jgi:hypothetical protein
VPLGCRPSSPGVRGRVPRTSRNGEAAWGDVRIEIDLAVVDGCATIQLLALSIRHAGRQLSVQRAQASDSGRRGVNQRPSRRAVGFSGSRPSEVYRPVRESRSSSAARSRFSPDRALHSTRSRTWRSRASTASTGRGLLARSPTTVARMATRRSRCSPNAWTVPRRSRHRSANPRTKNASSQLLCATSAHGRCKPRKERAMSNHWIHGIHAALSHVTLRGPCIAGSLERCRRSGGN